jgi:Ser/Thr protein kinase RdoA (MazF antagonist)
MGWSRLPKVQTHNVEMHDVFRVQNGRQVYFFKIYRHEIRERQDILNELRVIDRLRMAGLPVVRTAADTGKSVIRINFPEGTRFAVLWRAVDGDPVSRMTPPDGIGIELAKVLARCHHATEDLHLTSTSKIFSVEKTVADALCVARNHPLIPESLRKAVIKAATKLSRHNFDRLPRAICHGDAHFGNVLWHRTTGLRLIDFDLCMEAPRVYDLAVFLGERAAFIKNEKGYLKLEKSTLNAYDTISALRAEEIAAIPALVLYRYVWVIIDLRIINPIIYSKKFIGA